MASQGPLESSIDIDASPETVWNKVSDLKAMSRRSPELVTMKLFGAPRPGRRGVNLNRRKAFVWPSTSRIVRWKPTDHDGSGAMEFHVWPSKVNWSYEVEPRDGGARLTERRSAVPAQGVVVRLTSKWALGGAESHDAELLDGINTTLAAIKAEAESNS